jgi:hypothetical protein
MMGIFVHNNKNLQEVPEFYNLKGSENTGTSIPSFERKTVSNNGC